MSRNTDERITEEAREKLHKEQRKEQAKWVAKAIGLAAQEYPQIMRAFGRALFRDYLLAVAGFDERLTKFETLPSRVEALEARMGKAAKLVGEIDKYLRGQNGKPAQPTRTGR